MYSNEKDRGSSQSGETSDDTLDPPGDNQQEDQPSNSLTTLGRRRYLGILGLGATSSVFASRSVTAQTDTRYGLGEYGESEYGVGAGDTTDSDAETPIGDGPGDDGPEDEAPADDEPTDDEDSEDDAQNDDSTHRIVTVDVDPQATAATLSGLLWTDEDVDSLRAFFQYREENTQDWSATTGALLTSWGAFEQQLTALSAATVYEYRAAVDADDEIIVGEKKTFETLSLEEASPSVDLLSVTETPNRGRIELSIKWKVSDPKGELDTVVVVVSNYRRTLNWNETSESGATASGSETVAVKRGNNRAYEVTVVVRDTAGNLDIQRRQL